MEEFDIFLNYRKVDSINETRIIKLQLEKARYKVFMDETIHKGEHWPNSIKDALSTAKIIITVIGEKWLTCQGDGGIRRIDEENDWVRLELETAFQKKKKVIPVLINNAIMPLTRQLPENIKELANKQALIISQKNLMNEIQILLKELGKDIIAKAKPLIVLTSESPRRKELLRQIGWEEGKGKDYVSIHASVSLETKNVKFTIETAMLHAEKIAKDKIFWFKENFQHTLDVYEKIQGTFNPSQTIIIGVDTIVFYKDKILDRPLLKALYLAGREEKAKAKEIAREMLTEQSGQDIYIITSVVIATGDDNKLFNKTTVYTKAKLRKYDENDVDNYILYSEPFDRAGALGIQEKGVSLFESIEGSYTNIVGLPIREFAELLMKNYGNKFDLPEFNSTLYPNKEMEITNSFSAVCVGDINYDLVYDEFPENFFANLRSPGNKTIAPIYRAAGGTGVMFARGLKKVQFSPCYVVGILAGDALGHEIAKELRNDNIEHIGKTDPNEKTSIAIILRDSSRKDTSITITDHHQALNEQVVNSVENFIKKSDILYCSGYPLMDENRKSSVLKMLKIAKESKTLIILDIVVNMSKKNDLRKLVQILKEEEESKVTDIVVSELPEIFEWLSIPTEESEMQTWLRNKEKIISEMRANFHVSILRTSDYTSEIIITPNENYIPKPELLDYVKLKSREKIGYGDFRTAKQLYSFLSPRIVLASESPQRFTLLSQIVDSSKIEIIPSKVKEDKRPGEEPEDRVMRLASEKAREVFIQDNFHDDIELIIGADTEIYLSNSKEKMIGHPQNITESIKDLNSLNGKIHFAVTGIAIIGKDPNDGEKLKIVTASVTTKVTFANLSSEEIKKYADTNEPIKRAGAYAIQGLGTMLVEKIEGSYSNVVGLPLERLSEIMAKEFQKPIWIFNKVSNWTFPAPIKGLSLNDK